MYQQIESNKRKTILLMALFFALIVGLGYALALYYNNSGILVVALIVSILSNWVSYWWGDKAILGLSGARLLNHDKDLQERQIYHLVENLCIAAGVPIPSVYIINDPALNAFATGRDPKHASIALTTGLIEQLDKTELEGVIAHELSHVRNYDILLATVVVTLLGLVVMVSDWTLRARWYGHSDSNKNDHGGNWLAIVGLILIILSPILARLIYFTISRQREYLADASGALLTRYPEGLANALRKISSDKHKLRVTSSATAGLYIVNPFKKTSEMVTELFSTHPPIEKRIAALVGMNITAAE
ncbi:zinc metalloprotease HtpX [candidate division Kazan bacterium RIFCSPHIGHO2_01_FULL_49_10]|uniref:Protease HtpX homolog n=1 Tax=candidate division Kazan bacterium RIFCSPLOWO2_01_FULL_48_13 TaxID=1798539 RepID=A0A1F4PQ03_UNCK3|nr:MAG: zinc metalloprotease HtpX [candidate division Kazan bacterium RIFCSPHIGHO2_01_FULL_49_10]OGB85666.1 MAG: zinc metalloprotease HtpX [candidate division Kazan bacterium RIFCSPLOWO2_01_FULL_48_13]